MQSERNIKSYIERRRERELKRGISKTGTCIKEKIIIYYIMLMPIYYILYLYVTYIYIYIYIMLLQYVICMRALVFSCKICLFREKRRGREKQKELKLF